MDHLLGLPADHLVVLPAYHLLGLPADLLVVLPVDLLLGLQEDHLQEDHLLHLLHLVESYLLALVADHQAPEALVGVGVVAVEVGQPQAHP